MKNLWRAARIAQSRLMKSASGRSCQTIARANRRLKFMAANCRLRLTTNRRLRGRRDRENEMTDKLRKAAQDVVAWDDWAHSTDRVWNSLPLEYVGMSEAVEALRAALAETPSVDALIAEIDEVCFDENSGGYFHRLDIGGAELSEILDKYRARGGA